MAARPGRQRVPELVAVISCMWVVERPVLLREDEFRSLIRDGRRRMPAFAAVLDEPRQADLLAWLRRGR